MSRFHQSLQVRYYPERLRRTGIRRLSPGQALHLANDPERAALAQRTCAHRQLLPSGAGRLRIAIKRLLRR